MTDFNMLNILKKFNSVGTKQLSESTVTECGGMSSAPNTPVTVNLSAGSAGEMAMILRALSGIESGGGHSAVGLMASPMDDPDIPGRDDIEGDDDMQDGVLGGVAGAALGGMTAGIPGAIAGGYLGHKTQQAADKDKRMEEWDNEPEEEYSDHKTMTKTLSGGINRQKQMFKPAAKGDNPMAVETIKDRLLKALAEAKKSKKDYDGDGKVEKPSDEWKGSRDKAIKKAMGKKTNEARSLDQMDPIRQEVFYFLRDIYNRLEDEQDADVTDEIVDGLGDMRSEVMSSGDPLLINHYKAVRMAAGDNDALYDAINAALHDLVEEDDSPKQEAEFQAPTHELSDTSRKAMNIAQKIKRKINSGEQMDDRDYNQMAELGAILSRFGASFGPKSMKDVMAHMVQYTNDRNEEGHGYPKFDVNRFKELIAMASGKSESYAPVSEISSDLAKRYTKAAKMDRDFNDDDIDRLSKSGQSTQDMHRRNAKRTKGINQAKKRM
jgi:hypothetical protein